MMKFYRLSYATDIGKKLDKMMREALECDRLAHDFAEKCGATSYIPAVGYDAGGIAALGLAEDSRRKWGGAVELVVSEEYVNLYEPKVEVKEELMLSESALEFAKQSKTIVSQTELDFALVSPMLSRGEAAKMAGMELKERSMESFLKSLSPDKDSLSRIKGGKPLEEVFPDASPSMLKEMKRIMAEDALISAALSGKKFRRVYFLSGSRKAVRLYKDLFFLPVVPGGSFASLLQLEGKTTRPAIMPKDEYFYIKTSFKSELAYLEEVEEEEWEEAIK